MRTFNSLNHLIKLGLVAGALVTLTACSTTGGGAQQSRNIGGGEQGSQVSTHGLGIDHPVRSMNVSDQILLKAPYDQSYYFGFDKSKVRSKYIPSIKAQANYLVNHPDAQVLLIGNTDQRGSHEYNIALGERRALAVANHLKMQGVSADQIRKLSYGDMKPIAKGHTEAAYAKNRRVDFIYEAK